MTVGRMLSHAPTLLFVFAMAIYGWQASQTPMLDSQLAARESYLTEVVRMGAPQEAADDKAAAAYWSRYPDVAADPYYGREGPLGRGGALQHFRDHGQREGRVWGR